MFFEVAPAGQIHCNLIVEQDRTGHIFLHPVVADLKMAIHLQFFEDTAHSKADRTAEQFWKRSIASRGRHYLGVTKPTMLDIFHYSDELFNGQLVLSFDESVINVVKDPKVLMLAEELGEGTKYLIDPKYRVETKSHLDLLVEHFDHWVHLGRTKSLQPWCITVGGGVGSSRITLELRGALEVNFNHSAISRVFPKGSRGKEYMVRLLVLALRTGRVVIPGLYRGQYDWDRLDPSEMDYHSTYDHHEGRTVKGRKGTYCLIERMNELVGKYIEPVGKFTHGGRTKTNHDFIHSEAWKQSMDVLRFEIKYIDMKHEKVIEHEICQR